MPGGRPPKPTALKLLHGTARNDRINPNEPKFAVLADAKPPTWLKGRGRKAWADLAPMLIQIGVLTEADRPALLMLCDTYGEWMDLRDVVRREGHTYEVETKTGTMIMNRPEVAQASDCWRRVNLMLGQFGMTPASRTKVSAASNSEDVDPFEELLGKRA